MDAVFTIFAKMGERVIAKRCSPDLSRDELINYLFSKWSGKTKTNVSLKYEDHGSGEVELNDDEDKATMFSVLHVSNTRRVNIIVRPVSVNSSQAANQSPLVPGNQIVEYNNQDGVIVNNYKGETFGQKLRSDEWRDLIKGPGQFFPGGAVDFRRALILYSSKVGFEYKYAKNDRLCISAVCKLKKESGCKWRISASVDSIDQGFFIRTYERCGVVSHHNRKTCRMNSINE